MKIWLILSFSAFLYFTVEGKDAFSAILEKIPKDELKDFLQYHINLGYHISKVDITRNKKIPQEITNFPLAFSTSLYKYYHEKKLKSAGSQPYITVCIPNKGCHEIDDPGIHPRNIM